MPGFSGTGPGGMGPGTGRGLGPCGGYGYGTGTYAPRFGYVAPAYGPRFGYGAAAYGPRFFGGGGRGYRNMFWATGLPGWYRAGYAPAWGWGGTPFYATPQQERQALEAELEQLRGAISGLEARLRDFETTEEQKPQE